jgi:predicted RNase H-like nuclease
MTLIMAVTPPAVAFGSAPRSSASATALAAAVTARMAQGDYRTLPENVETDQEGLRMEMVYTQ